MSRREIREQIFNMLFRVEFYAQEDLTEQYELFAEDLPEIRPADLEYIENKIKKIEEVLEDIKQRDYRDMTRELNPLKKADDALEVDTTGLSIEEVTDRIVKEIR